VDYLTDLLIRRYVRFMSQLIVQLILDQTVYFLLTAVDSFLEFVAISEAHFPDAIGAAYIINGLLH